MANIAFNKTDRHEDLPPPASEVGVYGWLRHNLFSTWYNAVGTLVVLYLFYLTVPAILNWALFDAVWEATSNQDCQFDGAGACWGFIDARLNLFWYGFYDVENYWRPTLVGLLMLVLAIPVLFEQIPKKLTLGGLGVFALGWAVWSFGGLGQVASLNIAVAAGVLLYLALTMIGVVLKGGRAACALAIVGVFPWVAISLLYGPLNVESLNSWLGAAIYAVLLIGGGGLGYYAHRKRDALGSFLGYLFAYAAVVIIYLNWGFGLTVQATNTFGGLMLTLVISVVAIGVSLPLGIILALGRRASSMPAVQTLCIGFIELVRAVPLITILFMAQFMLPLFLPEGVNFDNVVRALVGVSMFASAYMAEVVRGGLQAIPKGQFEAADSLGLNYFLKMRLIILPQALKIVIPGIVSTFIGLFKDTSLVSIIGLMDLLLIAKSSVTDSRWLGLEHEAYFFISLIYFVFCFGMSRYSIYLERRLHTGHKR